MEINFDLKKLNNKRVGVAVSGGSDSMALLHFLVANAKDYGYSVLAINVDHCMRGDDSTSDSKFVKDYCDKIGVDIISFCAKTDGVTLAGEDSARSYRYACFNKVIKANRCDLIATAHHKSDFVETTLINLFRGSGASGLTGIKEHNGHIVRPFIYTDKSQIDAYVADKNIPFVSDSTNFETDFARNFLRLNVLPLIKEKFPQAENNIQKFATVLSAEDEYLNDLASHLIFEEYSAVKVRLDKREPILARAFVIAVKKVGIIKDYEKKHVDALINLRLAQNGTTINLPKGILAVKEYDCVALYPYKEKYIKTTPFAVDTIALGDKKILVKRLDSFANDGGQYLDLDKIPDSAVFRTRRDGDVFKPYRSGSKKLKEYLSDKKIPLRLRDELLLLADGNSVLCVVGVEISDFVKITDDTKRIVKLIEID